MLLLDRLLLLLYNLLVQVFRQVKLFTQPLDLFHGVRHRRVDQRADGVGKTGERYTEGGCEGEDLGLDVGWGAGGAMSGVLSGSGGSGGLLRGKRGFSGVTQLVRGKGLTDPEEVAVVIAAAATLLADAAALAAPLAAAPLPAINAQYPPASRAQTVTLQM